MNKKILLPGITLILATLLIIFLFPEKHDRQKPSNKTETPLKSPSRPTPTGKFNYGDTNHAEERFVFPSPIPSSVEGNYFKEMKEQKELFDAGSKCVGTKWEEALRICDGMGLKEGDCIADIGTAYGHDAIMFSQVVGPTGKVFATDANPGPIYYLLHMKREMARKYGKTRGFYFNNLNIMLNSGNDLVLPAETLDFALLKGVHNLFYLPRFNDYYEDIKTVNQKDLKQQIYESQSAFIKTVHSALKPDGRLVLIDGGTAVAITKETLIQLMDEMNFTLEKDLSRKGYAMDDECFYIFRKKTHNP